MKSNKHFSFFVIILLTSFVSIRNLGAFALNFEKIDNRVGLSSDNVTCIFQDDEGFIWIGTLDGLNCYTGTEFKVYKKKRNDKGSISSSRIRGMCSAPDGKLWVATENHGINILDRHTGQFVKLNTTSPDLPLLSNQINTIYRDSKDRIWITTPDGINMYDAASEQMKSYFLKSPRSHFSSTFEDAKGHIFIAAWNKRMFYYVPEIDGFKQIDLPGKLMNSPIKSMCEDHQGYLWLGTWAGGLYKTRYENGSIQIIEYFEISNQYYSSDQTFSIVYDMAIDRDGHLWIGSDVGLGVIHSGEHSIEWIPPGTSSNSFNEKDARHLCVDAANTLWIGTFGDGVSKLDFNHTAFETYTIKATPSKYSTNIFRSFWYFNDELYTGVSALGFGKYDLEERRFTPYTSLPEFKGLHKFQGEINCVISFEQLSDRYLWIGTRYRGLYIYDLETHQAHKIKLPINYNRNSCYLIEEDRIWIGNESGLVLCLKDSSSKNPVFPYSKTSFKKAEGQEGGLSGSAIVGIIRDKDQRVWLAYQDGGIDEVIYDEAAPKELSFIPSTVNTRYDYLPMGTTLYEDSQGHIWLGTSGDGLWLFDKEEKMLENFSAKHAIPGDIVSSIIEDDYQQLWFSSNSGLTRLRIQDLNQPSFTNYTVEDGLQGNIFIENSLAKSAHGELIFGGYHGFNYFDPSEIRHNHYIPPLAFTSIEVDRTLKHINPEEDIVLSHRNNSIQFSFVALSYTKSENNTYQYKLDGYDDTWIKANKGSRTAVYGKLPPGNYTFMVKGSNNNGIWNEKPIAQTIRVKKAPYNTAFAYVLYVSAVLMVFWLYFHYTNRSFKLKQAVLNEQNERQKAEKIDQFKLKFFTNISHELLTPLSIISNAIEQYLDKKPDEGPDLAIVQRNTNRLSRLINQILDFRKVEGSSRKLSVEPAEVNIILSSITDNFIPLCEKKNIRFNVKGNVQDGLFIDIDKIEKILHNLLSNAFKHTPENGEITLAYKTYVNKGVNYLTVSISDSGKGIPEDLMNQIFERFYRIDDRKHEPGAGIGLAFTRALLNLHKGNISVENIPEGGAKFTFEVPVSEHVYSDDEKRQEDSDEQEEVEYSFAEEMDEIKIPLRENRETKGELPKILLVDDNHDMRTIMRNFLSKYFEIYESENGYQGLATLNTVDIDLIVSDIMMPEMDGITFCRKVKNNIVSSHIPVILTTAKRSQEDFIEGYEAQADSYITKPVNLKLLMVRIINLINSRKKLHKIFSGENQEAELSKLDISSLDQQLFEKINRVIEENLSDCDLTVSRLSKDVGVSTSALYRKVKSFAGLSPNEYIRTKRLNYAAELLRQHCTPTEATYKCGFSDPSYFSACFKKQFGVPPRKYIESL